MPEKKVTAWRPAFRGNGSCLLFSRAYNIGEGELIPQWWNETAFCVINEVAQLRKREFLELYMS